jgi:hypothetical protein
MNRGDIVSLIKFKKGVIKMNKGDLINKVSEVLGSI